MARRIVLFIVIMVACLVPGRSYAQDTERPSHATIVARIAEARRLLAGARIGTSRIGGDNAVLAVWNPSHPSLGVRTVQVLNGTSRTRGFGVEVTLRNGVNSRYRVTPEGWQVIAIRTNARAGRRSSAPAVYVPYDPALHTPEMEREGRAYLVSLLVSARARLRDRHVSSQAVDGELVPDVVPDRALLALLIIEHVDPDDFARDGARASMGRVFVTAALNRGDAYRYAGSYAGALGLAQFIRGTYDLTRRRYAAAGLPRDFRAGMGDHVAAVTAQYCLADWSLSRLPEAERRRLRRPENEEDLGAFLAAAYNGGEDRAANAYQADRARWELAGHGLAGQTVGYVAEFRATYRELGH